jgi:anti-sigma factor RsiW
MDEHHPNRDAADDPKANGPDDPAADLVAYLDGELERASNAAVESTISRDPAVRAEVDSLKKTWDLLDFLPRPDPSPHFTEKTLSKLDPIRKIPSGTLQTLPSNSSGQTAKTARSSTGTARMESARRSLQRRLLLAATCLLAIGVAAGAGYFGRALVVNRLLNPMDQQEQDARILTDRRLLQNLPLYRNVDDIEFLKALDQPELFGEEQSTPLNEGPK